MAVFGRRPKVLETVCKSHQPAPFFEPILDIMLLLTELMFFFVEIYGIKVKKAIKNGYADENG